MRKTFYMQYHIFASVRLLQFQNPTIDYSTKPLFVSNKFTQHKTLTLSKFLSQKSMFTSFPYHKIYLVILMLLQTHNNKYLTSSSCTCAKGLIARANGTQDIFSISAVVGTLQIVDRINLGLQIPKGRRISTYFFKQSLKYHH